MYQLYKTVSISIQKAKQNEMKLLTAQYAVLIPNLSIKGTYGLDLIFEHISGTMLVTYNGETVIASVKHYYKITMTKN